MHSTRALQVWLPATFRQRPWPRSKAIAPRLAATEPIEEEKSPYYRSNQFSNIKIGEVLGGRYQVAVKLGCGARATVWLARDLYQSKWNNEKYVAVKVQARERDGTDKNRLSEIELLKVITNANRRHPGYDSVRTLLNKFQIPGPTSPQIKNDCMVFEPMRESWTQYQQRFRGNKIIPACVKIDAHVILTGLDYLHSECSLIHTDINPYNILVGYEKDLSVRELAESEYEEPLPQKHYPNGDIIYLSQHIAGGLRGIAGRCKLTDFDGAVSDAGPHFGGSISTNPYEPPESLLDSGFSYAADIWSFGITLLTIIEGKALFLIPSSSTEDRILEDPGQLRLAYITALLGPAPSALIQSGRKSSLFYDSTGQLKNQHLIPSDFSLDTVVTSMTGENKRLFINFIKRMLTWRPEDRATAKDLLDDPWLHTKFRQEDTGAGYPAHLGQDD